MRGKARKGNVRVGLKENGKYAAKSVEIHRATIRLCNCRTVKGIGLVISLIH